jgi:uncharacterized protein (DUF2132 family)
MARSVKAIGPSVHGTMVLVHRTRWFRKPVEEVYVGGATVWHSWPSGRRAGTLLEAWLCDVETAWKFEKKPLVSVEMQT